jgi:hypothetical protein
LGTQSGIFAKHHARISKHAGRVGALAAALTLSVGIVVVGAQAASASGVKLYVNGTGGSNTLGGNPSTCRLLAHPCLTIGYALSVAPSGATIDVASDTYQEQLTITQNVTITGAGAANTIIEPTTLTTVETDTDSNTAQAVIVYVEPNVTSANLKDLTVNGSAASGSFTAGSTDYVGVYYRDAGGTVSNVTVTDVQQPTAFGDQPGPNGGIYVATDSSTTAPTGGNGNSATWIAPPAIWDDSAVSMTDVTVNNYDKNGITCDDVDTVCTIKGAVVTGLGPIPNNSNPNEPNAQNGIQVWGASASIKSSDVSGNSYTSPGYSPSTAYSYATASGILVINADTLTISTDTVESNDVNVYALWYPGYFPGSASFSGQGVWAISHNTASDATNNTGTVTGSTAVPYGDGFGDGIDLDGASATVEYNTASDNAEYGIGLFDSAGSLIKSNTTNSETGDGIYVGDNAYNATSNSGIAANVGASTGDNITKNTSDDNGLDGILADVTSQDTGNSFTHNILESNIRYDAEDLSTGSGTAGTANIWTNNNCHPAADGSPAGIC